MKPSEVRERILAEHAALRTMLDEIEGMAEAFEREGGELGPMLQEKGLALYSKFLEHINLEDETLAPALRATAPSGAERADRLDHEHREQRELLKYLVSRLDQDSRPTLLVARELRNFVEYVRQDMEHEESTMLKEGILRDAG